MIFSNVFGFALAAAASVSAVPLERRATVPPANQTGPFQLYVESTNATLNGSFLDAVHSGAAIETLQVTLNKTLAPGYANIFNFNLSTSNYFPYPDITGTEQGFLVWELRGSNFNESEPLSFQYSPFTNDAPVLFEPTTGSTFYWKDDKLITVQYTSGNKATPVIAYDRWYACSTPLQQGGGYSYFSIHWGLGASPPENPTCQKVSIKRKFL